MHAVFMVDSESTVELWHCPETGVDGLRLTFGDAWITLFSGQSEDAPDVLVTYMRSVAENATALAVSLGPNDSDPLGEQEYGEVVVPVAETCAVPVEPAGHFATTPQMDEAGNAWLSLTDDERSELLHQRRHHRLPDNSLPRSEPE